MKWWNGSVVTDKARFADDTLWRSGLPETVCGLGSTITRTKSQRRWIPSIVEKYGIRSIANVGAGDLNWWDAMDIPGVRVIHLDVVPRHPDVEQFDITEQVPPVVDMITCFWVLEHLPPKDRTRALKNMAASGATYLMTTGPHNVPGALEVLHVPLSYITLTELTPCAP